MAGAPRCCPEPLRQPNQCLPPHPSTFAFSGFGRCQTAAALPTKWQPVGPESCWGSAVSDACSPATLAAVTCLWSGVHRPCPRMLVLRCMSTYAASSFAGGCDVPLEWLVPHGAAQSRYVNPTNACHPTHPPLLLAGSKVPNGSGSADQVATRWA